MPEQEVPFTSYLLALSNRGDRQARDLVKDLAGLGQHFEEIRQHPAVLRATNSWRDEQTPYWVTVAQDMLTVLVAIHPQQQDGNMGSHLAQLDIGGVDKVFQGLVRVPSSEAGLLYQRLWSAVHQLRSAGVGVNWHRLYRDVQQWMHPDFRRGVIRRWVRSYTYREGVISER